MGKVKDILKKNTMLFVLVFVMILFEVLIVTGGKGGSLFSPANITNLISQNGYVVILATGMLMCILTGGNIDLAVGSIVAFVGAIAGTLIVTMKANVYLSIALCLLIGTLIGAWQAFWIAYVRIPAFIVTLAGMLTFRGLATIILGGFTISKFPAEYSQLFNSYLPQDPASLVPVTMGVGAAICIIFVALSLFSRVRKQKKGYAVEVFGWFIAKMALLSAVVLYVFWLLSQNKGMPVVLILLAAVVLFYSYYTSSTVSGRHLYAMGGNEKAAKLSGVNTNNTLFFAYTNMGFLSAVAALVCVARFDSAFPAAGDGYELDAIASCFIGGASAFGGVGTVGGAVIGAVFMGVLNNGMSLLGIDANWQKTVKGLVLLGAVVFDVLSKRRKVSTKKAAEASKETVAA